MSKSTWDPAVRQYFSEVGVRWPTNMDTFRRQARERYGEAVLGSVFGALGDKDRSTPAFYEAKNRNLRLSIDLSFQVNGNFYGEYLTGVAIEHRKYQQRPRRVLDLGCDCGFLTCFYARHFPEAEVVGVDASDAGLAAARQLAAALRLENVAFQKVDLRANERVNLPHQEFDLITATFILNDIEQMPPIGPKGAYNWASLPAREPWSRIMAKVAPLLAPKGILFSSERVDNQRAVAWWARALGEAGLNVLWDRSALFVYDSVLASRDGKLRPHGTLVLTCQQGAMNFDALGPKARGFIGTWA